MLQTEQHVLIRRLDLGLIHKKNRTSRLVDLTVLTGLKVKIKESEKIDKYLYFARELKNLLNIRVTA